MILLPSVILITNSLYATLGIAQVERIQVSASRNLLNSQNIKSSKVETLNPHEQVSLNRSIADWLNQLPGISMNGQGGLMQSYSIRGLSKARIRTEIDGIPIITDRRAGNSVSFIPPNLFSDVVVQKGASSTLYGSDAMGGVISLSTITPQELKISLSQQTNGTQTEASISNGNDILQTGLSYRSAKNSHAANGKELNTQFKQTAGLFKYKTDFDNFTTQTSVLMSKTSDIGKSTSEFPEKKITLYPSEFHSLSQFQLSYKETWLVKLYHHYQNWESQVDRVESRQNNTFYQAHTIGSLFYSQHELLNGEGRLGFEWIGRRGVKISEKEYNHQKALAFSANLLEGNQDNLGLFLDNHWQVNKLKFMVGLRYDYINQANLITNTSRHDSKLNTSLSATYLISDKLKFQSEFGTGFRFPTLSELYFNGETPRGTTLGNINLEPETSKSYSIDMTYQLDSSQLLVSAFTQNLNNYIQRYRINSELRSYQNIEEANIKGIEISYEFQIKNNSTHQISFQKQIGTNEADEVLADLAPTSWTLNSQWYFNKSNIINNLSYKPKNTDFSDGEKALDGTLLWDLKWQYSINNQLEISLSANNLLDKLYFGSSDEDADFQPGRSFGITLSYQND
jgi:iron complex outermembrane receptor protein